MGSCGFLHLLFPRHWDLIRMKLINFRNAETKLCQLFQKLWNFHFFDDFLLNNIKLFLYTTEIFGLNFIFLLLQTVIFIFSMKPWKWNFLNVRLIEALSALDASSEKLTHFAKIACLVTNWHLYSLKSQSFPVPLIKL